MFCLEEELKKLPKKPGVYLMHDQADAVIYVGKAVNLYQRVHSYFREHVGRGPWIDKMIQQIAWFEYIVTDSELEALVLENNLIKEYHPKYNTLLKDGKTYPYIKITMGEAYPRVLLAREVKKDKAKYFGPFSSGTAVKDTIELLNKLFLLRTCNQTLPKDMKGQRPCLNYHIKQCNAPCIGAVTPQDYMQQVQKAIEFLNGNIQPIVLELTQKMQNASIELEFEEAAKYRDLLESIQKTHQKQKITDHDSEDKDMIAFAKEADACVVQVFFIRNGKMIGREHYYMMHVDKMQSGEIIQEFIKQFYGGTPFIPREVFIQCEIEEQPLLEAWLTKRKGSKVVIRIPKKGSKEKLLALAVQNAKMVLQQDKESLRREQGRTIGAVQQLETLLGLQQIGRMEAFDISNTNGFENVGSMVVFEQGRPKRSDYRKFRMKTVSGPDDYACMREVLTRRFLHGMQEQQELEEKQLDQTFGSFSRFPDLILMDGGKGQVQAAMQVLEELQISIPVCGMVKDDHHRTRGLYFQQTELEIDTHSEAFQLITRIQDEAHRFAIEYHRSLRSKQQVKSSLDEIPGIGPVRRKALMQHFDSVAEIKEASIEQLCAVSQIPKTTAEEIYRFFHR